MSGYEIAFSITALCPCCGKELPSSSYLTESKPSGYPFDRDNPYERKDRRVFITPCMDCFEPKRATPAPQDTEGGLEELYRALSIVGVVGQIDGHDVIRRLSVLDVVRDRQKREGS